MQLSRQAIIELKEVLKDDLGHIVENLSEAELQELGAILLTIDKTYLKVCTQSK